MSISRQIKRNMARRATQAYLDQGALGCPKCKTPMKRKNNKVIFCPECGWKGVLK